MNQRQKATSLTYLLNEVMDSKKFESRTKRQLVKYSMVDSLFLESMLSSGFFTRNESTAVRVLFRSSRSAYINESTINSLDSIVNGVVEAIDQDRVLSEGILGDIWDGLKKLGNKTKEAITGGWSKIKTIWGEFKELIDAFIANIVAGLKVLLEKGKQFAIKTFNSFQKKISDKFTSVMNGIDKLSEKKEFANELTNANKTAVFVKTKFYTELVSPNAEWAKSVAAGKGNPTEDGKLSPEEADAAIEDLKQEEGVRSLKQIVEDRNNLFSNKNFLMELSQFSKRRITESDTGAMHLEDAISNPWLKKIVKILVELLQFALIPIAKGAQFIGKLIGPTALNAFSSMVSMPGIGGPGAYKFPVLGLIAAEVIEVIVKFITPSGPDLAKDYLVGFADGLIKFLEDYSGWIKAIKIVLTVWTIGTILMNIIGLLQTKYKEIEANKQGGETPTEPEVQTAGYKPKGEFKIKEGKLVFIS